MTSVMATTPNAIRPIVVAISIVNLLTPPNEEGNRVVELEFEVQSE